MHSFYLIAAISLDPATAGKILGEMGAVYGILQGLKKAFPALTGKWAITLNVTFSIVGATLIIPPSSFFSIDTLGVLLLAGIQAAGSAGIHGTVQNVAPVALQTVLGQGPKTDATASNLVSVSPTVVPGGPVSIISGSTTVTIPAKSDPYEDILK